MARSELAIGPAARPHYERSLAVYEKVLGAEHLWAMAIFETRLGPDHPDTKIVGENWRYDPAEIAIRRHGPR